jgi:anti-sigma regulatory factor (Ser/Thr protein kinase)
VIYTYQGVIKADLVEDAVQDGNGSVRSGVSAVSGQGAGAACGHFRRPDRVVAGSAITSSRDLQGSPSSVIRVARVFAGLPAQVAVAREFVRRVLGPVPVADEVALLVSELCTNALRHTASGHGGSFVVVVQPRSGSVRVEVRDEGSGPAPSPHSIDVLTEDGRGLGLVELIADNWGYGGDCHGGSVFFELTWARRG